MKPPNSDANRQGSPTGNRPAEPLVANRPADNISLKTFVMQTADNFFRRKTQHIRADMVPVERKDFLRHRHLLRLLSG